MQFLQQKAKLPRQDGQHIQIIVSTHSPNLASAIQLDNLVFLSSGKAYPLSSDSTELDASDYGFLARFLDVTKANLFFARGVMIVEGDAENLLLPTLARLLERDFTSSGVSVVNVGGIGLRRFARIFQRKDPAKHGAIPVPVACVTDMDVMPDCAPEITERVNVGAVWPEKGKRRWRAKKDFTADELTKRRAGIRAKASGQRVETFVSDEWTLEYDLAYAGLAREVWIAAHLAIEDDAITAGRAKRYVVTRNASRTFEALEARNPPQDELASRVYAPFLTHSKLSKATAAQYLAWRLEVQHRRKVITPQSLRAILPRYIVDAIDYVTSAREQATPGDSVTQVAGTSTGATAA